MSRERKAKLFRNGGSQAVRLPADFRFEDDEVYITRDDTPGDVILSARPSRDVWKEYIAFRYSLDIFQEEADTYMSERPMNTPARPRSIFEEEE